MMMMKAVIKSQRWKIFWVVFPKRANVTPVFKADAKDVVKLFRYYPFRVKCQERIVYNAVYPHVAPYRTDWQYGFVRRRSCATQLASLTINYHLEWGQTGGRCFLDFAKGFSRVAHNILQKKMGNFGISGALLNWCKDYLTDREQRVVIEGMNSTWCAILSGVPQGFLLGTFL